MLAALDQLITILAPITLVVFAAAWIYTLVSTIKKNRRGLIVGMAVGGVFILNIMTLASILTARARHDLIAFLDGKNGPFTAQVAERPDEDPDSLLAVLRSVRSLSAHHSYATTALAIRVSDPRGRVVNLVLKRDSSRPREYWVFQADYRTTSNNEVGRVVTPLFDGFRSPDQTNEHM